MTYIERPKANEDTRITVGAKPLQLARVLNMPPEYVQLVKDVAAKGATDEEFCLFLQICHDTGLNPLTKEIWFYKMWDGLAGRDMPVIHASIQGKRKAAERIGGYCPGRETEYKYDGEGFLVSATAYVKRKVAGDWQEIAFTAHWEEFAKYNRDNKLSGKWATMPKHMLGKVAENHALNRAFPTLETLADSDNLPTANFTAAFEAPPAETPEGADPAEVEGVEHKRGLLIDNLSHMAEIMLDKDKQDKLAGWMDTAGLEDLVAKHNSALIQFTQYARGVYEALPEGDRPGALETFNVAAYDDLGLEELLRFVYTYQKPIAEQEHPANVEVPPAPPKRGGRAKANPATGREPKAK